MRRLAVAAAVLTAAAAGAAQASTPDSGIRGNVTIGPTCPVERIPPDPACEPRRYDAIIRVRRRSDGRLVARTRSGSDGHYGVRLRRGRYTVIASPPVKSALPTPVSQDVVVHSHRFVRMDFVFDSGIR